MKRGYLCSVVGAAILLGWSGTALAQSGGYITQIRCERDAEKSATAPNQIVGSFERSGDILDQCDGSAPPDFCFDLADIQVGMACTEALAALYQSDPDFVQTETVQSGRPLLIVAEDIEGEALATIVPVRPHTDMVFLFGSGNGAGATTGCDFYARPGEAITTFVQGADGDGTTFERFTDPATAPSCAESISFAMFNSGGTPLRAQVSVAPGANRSIPDVIILDEPTTPIPEIHVGPKMRVEVGDRFSGRYFITTATHSID